MKKQKCTTTNSFLAVIITCMLISACAPKSEQSLTNSHTTLPVKKEIKPGAPVSLDSPSLVNISAGQSTDIDFALKTQGMSGHMHVDFIPGSGLQLLNTSATYDVLLDGSGSYPFKAELMAPNNGRFYLNLHISVDNGEAVSSRSLAIIVQVGPGAEEAVQSSKLLKTTGDSVISLPAEETVIHK